MKRPTSSRAPPQPLGASWTGRGINFAAFSASATRVELCLFDATGRRETARLALPARTGSIWHGFLPARFGGPGTLYGYRVHGPYQPSEGHRFNPAKLLVDPCATALAGDVTWHPSLNGAEAGNDWVPDAADSADYVPRSRVTDPAFDWGGVRSPSVPVARHDHLRAARQGIHAAAPRRTRAPARQVPRARAAGGARLPRGQAASPPSSCCRCQSRGARSPVPRKGLSNYWGYNPLAWFAPDARYAIAGTRSSNSAWSARCTRPGIELVLDVVFNHTAEGNEKGPTFSFRGIDNPNYYRLYEHNRATIRTIPAAATP